MTLADLLSSDAQVWYATLTTVGLAAGCILLSSTLAIALAKVRERRKGFLNGFVIAYVEFFRNTPLLIILYLFYFGLAQAGINLSALACVVLALTLNSSAYLTEVFRAGLGSVGKGQREGAAALGLSRLQAEFLVVWPQAIRNVLPAFTNQCVNVVIGTAVAAIVGIADISSWMLSTGSRTFRYFEVLLLAALLYALLCQMVIWILHGVEAYLDVGGGRRPRRNALR